MRQMERTEGRAIEDTLLLHPCLSIINFSFIFIKANTPPIQPLSFWKLLNKLLNTEHYRNMENLISFPC